MNRDAVDYYNQNPELEWSRLFMSPYRRLEYEVICHYLDRYLPQDGAILDVGGGPGRYAIMLAKRGYKITLLDISEANIQFAWKKIKAAGLENKFDVCRVGDARDLTTLANNSFDAVLCMGPLYHLLSERDRLQCLRECWRVMKDQAPLFVTVLPRLTYLRDALRSGTFTRLVPDGLLALDDIAERGHSMAAEVPETYYCHPNEVKILFEQTGFKLTELVSCHGFASFMDGRVNEIGKNAEAWNALIRWVLSTCNDPQALSMAEHIAGVGLKSR